MKQSTSNSQLGRHSPHSGFDVGNCILVIVGALILIAGSYSIYIKKSDITDWREKESISLNKGLSSQVSLKTATSKKTFQKTSKKSEKYFPLRLDYRSSTNEWTYSTAELIALLTEIKPSDSNSGLSLEDAAAIRDALHYLAMQGKAAIPAITSYLNSLDDVDYQNSTKQSITGYRSLRLALIDVLHQIGGQEAEKVLSTTLSKTRTPLEILQLSRYLSKFDPRRYRNQILESALTAFDSATNDGVDGQDAGPIFQVFQEYGKEGLIAKLEQMPRLNWGEYVSVVLANLKGGKGIPSLVRQVENASATDVGARFALKMLAQSAQYPAAQNALLASVANKQIPSQLWPELANIIAGTYQIQIENPNERSVLQSQSVSPKSVSPLLFFTPGGGQTLYGLNYSTSNSPPEQIEQRMQLITDLLAATDDPEAVSALENSYLILKAVSETVSE